MVMACHFQRMARNFTQCSHDMTGRHGTIGSMQGERRPGIPA